MSIPAGAKQLRSIDVFPLLAAATPDALNVQRLPFSKVMPWQTDDSEKF